MRTSGIVLCWHKCLDLMDKLNKDEAKKETLIMDHIKRKDPFMRLRLAPGVLQ